MGCHTSIHTTAVTFAAYLHAAGWVLHKSRTWYLTAARAHATCLQLFLVMLNKARCFCNLNEHISLTPAMSQCARRHRMQMLLQAKSEYFYPHYMVSNLLVFQKELVQSRLPLLGARLLVVDLPPAPDTDEKAILFAYTFPAANCASKLVESTVK